MKAKQEWLPLKTKRTPESVKAILKHRLVPVRIRDGKAYVPAIDLEIANSSL
jgi:hypothetical protein